MNTSSMKLQIGDTRLRYFPETKQVRFDYGHLEGFESYTHYKVWSESDFIDMLKHGTSKRPL